MAGTAYCGTGKDFEKLIQPHVNKVGKMVCTYPQECAKVQESKTIPKAILKEDQLVLLLWRANKHLMFPQKTIETGLGHTMAANKDKWGLSKEDAKDWTETMTRRMRNLLRVISQPMSKGKTPAWLKKMSFFIAGVDDVVGEEEEGEEEEEEEGEEEEEEDEQATEECDDDADDDDDKPLVPRNIETIKFNKELMLATMQHSNNNEEQVSLPITDNPQASGNDIVYALFPGNQGRSIPGLTFRILRDLIRSCKSKDLLWQTEHAETHHAIHVAQRIDRHLLICIYEQSRQRMQVRMSTFGDVIDEMKKEPMESKTLQIATKFVQAIAEKFAAGELSHQQLTAHRDAKLAAEGYQPVLRGKMKPTLANDGQVGRAASSADSPVTSEVIKRPAAANKSSSKVAKVDQAEPAIQPASLVPTGYKSSVHAELPDIPKSTMDQFFDFDWTK
jgi:predicted GIY-YIG superfamily endonuclease